MSDLLSTLTICEGRRVQLAAGGAWDREARTAVAAAAAQGITLRVDDLVYLDVHDLQALRWRFEQGRDPNGHFGHRPRAA